MIIKVLANGFYVGENAYLKSGWNVMDGFLVVVSIVDLIITARSGPVESGSEADATSHLLGVLRVLRLLRALRPLRSECMRMLSSD